jgi:hypothetical protein
MRLQKFKNFVQIHGVSEGVVSNINQASLK